MINRFIILFLFIVFPFLLLADGMKGLAYAYELYSGFCLFLALGGMLVLMFGKNRMLIAVFATITVLAGLPIIFIIADWEFEKDFMPPLFCFFIGLILAGKLLGKKSVAPVDKPGAK